jgi:hypothetical protein
MSLHLQCWLPSGIVFRTRLNVEAGVALLIAMFALLLISAVAISMIVATDDHHRAPHQGFRSGGIAETADLP